MAHLHYIRDDDGKKQHEFRKPGIIRTKWRFSFTHYIFFALIGAVTSVPSHIYKTAGSILTKLHKQRFTSPSRLFALATVFCTVAHHISSTITAVVRLIYENVHELIRRKESAK